MDPIEIQKSNPALDLEAQEIIDSNTDASTVPDFVDYATPETVKVLPPAKYKLTLLISTLVYLAVWFADEVQVVQALMLGGWLSPDAALFVFLCITVFVMTYGALDLVVTIFTFQCNGKSGKPRTIGIGAWLKAPRSTWIYRYNQNVVVEILAIVIRILEDGFRMFDAPPCPRQGLAEKPKCFAPSPNDKPGESPQKVLKIEHRIDPSKLKEYNHWEERIAKAFRENATGVISVEKLPYQGKDGKEIEILGKDGSLLLDAKACQEISSEIGGLLRIIKLTFRDLDSLNEWMALPRRIYLFDELQPYLVVPDIIQIRENRELPDAFTDLMIRQGEHVPKLPPLKWKVWWLTTVALYLSIQWVTSFMAHYYEFWGLNSAPARIQDLVKIPITVFVNVYILVPLMLFIFDHWVKQRQVEPKVTKEPWRTLNDGFQSLWFKAFLTFIYYGGMATAWIVKAQ